MQLELAFAFNPDEGPARAIRYVHNIGGDLLAHLDKTRNLLIIDKDIFDELPEVEKHMLLRTHDEFTRYRRSKPGAVPEVIPGSRPSGYVATPLKRGATNADLGPDESDQEKDAA